MKREFLEGLSLDKEVVDKIMAENGKDIETEKAKTTAKETELTKANETIAGLQADIKRFDGVDVEKLKQAATEWETKYNNDIKTERDKTEKLAKEYTLKEALKGMGVSDPDYLIYKHGGLEKFAFDGDGKAVGLSETIAPYKESSPNLFAEDVAKANTGGIHGGTGDGATGVEAAFFAMNPGLKQ